jgi:hypothetical protein
MEEHTEGCVGLKKDDNMKHKLDTSDVIGLMILDVVVFGGLCIFMFLVLHSEWATIPLVVGFGGILALWGKGLIDLG